MKRFTFILLSLICLVAPISAIRVSQAKFTLRPPVSTEQQAENLRSKLLKLKGIDAAEVTADAEAGIIVSYDAKKITSAKIKQALKKFGYEAEQVKLPLTEAPYTNPDAKPRKRMGDIAPERPANLPPSKPEHIIP